MDSTTIHPIAVLISDVHYSLSTRYLADTAFRMAVNKAHELKVPLIDEGDLTNDKAILRVECINMLIDTMEYAKSLKVEVILLVGNHSLANEKGKEHSLNFLRPYARIVDEPEDYAFSSTLISRLIPYQSTIDDFRNSLEFHRKYPLTICHQGVQGAHLGDYYKDDSSIYPDQLGGARIISGHYHRKQDIVLPEGGLWSYVGNPYTLSFGEASDGPKGFCILYSDGSLEQIPTNLRKHVKVERTIQTVMDPIQGLKQDDLLWIQVTGPYTEIGKLNKKEIGELHLGHSNYKLEPVYSENRSLELDKLEKLTDYEILDSIIDSGSESENTKEQLKTMWREIMK